MRDYEIIIVFRVDTDDETRNTIFDRIKGWLPLIEGASLDDLKVTEWGRRQLAYPIQNLNEGYYILIEAELDGSGLSEMERNIMYVDEVLRHLVVRKDSF